jgi:hypothetical protein
MDAFGSGLGATGADAKVLLDEVFAWTHGHPYMTQRVCEVLVGRGGEGAAAERVRRAVLQAFLDPGRDRDPNLLFAEKYLEGQEVPAAEMMFLYRRLLEREEVFFDPSREVEQHLCLSGLAAARPGDGGRRRLEVRNRVFVEAFGRERVAEREAEEVFGEELMHWLAAPPERKGNFLLRGHALEEALARAQKRGELSAQEEGFLRASQEAEEKEERARVARRNAWMLTGQMALLVIVVGVAVWQYDVARAAVQRE